MWRIFTIYDHSLDNLVSSFMDWTVKMWYFKQDFAQGYGGKKFEIYWKNSHGCLPDLIKRVIRTGFKFLYYIRIDLVDGQCPSL